LSCRCDLLGRWKDLNIGDIRVVIVVSRSVGGKIPWQVLSQLERSRWEFCWNCLNLRQRQLRPNVKTTSDSSEAMLCTRYLQKMAKSVTACLRRGWHSPSFEAGRDSSFGEFQLPGDPYHRVLRKTSSDCLYDRCEAFNDLCTLIDLDQSV
jgi:hypothetical protein